VANAIYGFAIMFQENAGHSVYIVAACAVNKITNAINAARSTYISLRKNSEDCMAIF
jgi:hypothetical protein